MQAGVGKPNLMPSFSVTLRMQYNAIASTIGNTIFLVDDDSDDVEFMRMALFEQGYQGKIEVCINGRHFIQCLEDLEEHFSPDLILLDINMHVVNGLECLSYLQHTRFYKSVPVIMVSASAMEKNLRTTNELGALAYIIKPTSGNKFAEIAKAILVFLVNDTLTALAEHGTVF